MQDSINEVNSHILGISVEINKISDVIVRSQKGVSNSQVLIDNAVEEFKGIGSATRHLDLQANIFKDVL